MLPSRLRQRISTSAPTIAPRAQIDHRLVVRERTRSPPARAPFRRSDWSGCATASTSANAMISSASTAPPNVPTARRSRVLRKHRGARHGRGRDQRIAGRVVLGAESRRRPRRSLRGCRRAPRSACLRSSMTRTTGSLAALFGRAVGQEHVGRNVADKLQRIAGAAPSDAQRTLARFQRPDRR